MLTQLSRARFGFCTFTEAVLEFSWHCFQMTHASCTVCASFHGFVVLVNCKQKILNKGRGVVRYVYGVPKQWIKYIIKVD